MTQFENQAADQTLAASTVPDIGDAGPAWLTDAVALVSAGVFSLAFKLALQVHAGVPPMFAGLAAAAVCLGLVALHVVLRPSASHAGAVRRAPRHPAGMVASEPAFEPTLAHSHAGEIPAHDPAVSAPLIAAAVAEPRMPGPSHGLDHLQSLVAELARTTPGPKASTPDPDAPHQAATAEAWAHYAANRPDAPRQSAPLAPSMPDQQPAPLTGFAADLSDALAAERLTIFLEPIQQIEAGRPRYYEVSIRFRDETGGELPHRELLSAAREAGLLPRVDAAVLPRAARIAQHFRIRGRDTDIFSRVHAASLPDQDFRAEVTAATIAADGAALVLSFDQSDLRSFGPVHWEILSTMHDMGLRFAVEGVTDLDMDFQALSHRGFGFVKLDADVLLRGLPAFGGMIASADVCRHLSASGLALIVGHIDDDEALAGILGFGVLFGQGALFGSRRAVRSDILATPAAAA